MLALDPIEMPFGPFVPNAEYECISIHIRKWRRIGGESDHGIKPIPRSDPLP